MTQMSLGKLFLLSLVTFGIYPIMWIVRSKNEMNARGAQIPTGWLLIVPIGNLFFIWKYAQGVEHITGKQTTAGTAFLMMAFLGIIGMLWLQSKFNALPAPTAAAADPVPAG